MGFLNSTFFVVTCIQVSLMVPFLFSTVDGFKIDVKKGFKKITKPIAKPFEKAKEAVEKPVVEAANIVKKPAEHVKNTVVKHGECLGKTAETAAREGAAVGQLGLNKDANRAAEKSAKECGKDWREHGGKIFSSLEGTATNVLVPGLELGGQAALVALELGQNKDTINDMKHTLKKLEAGFAAHVLSREEPWFKGKAGSLGAWMRDIPDDTPITSLFLPGTHDSGARTTDIEHARCQSWTIKEQLHAGIRCFDIRLRMVGDEMRCYHDQFYMDLNIDSIVKAM
jgi:hypothetical protein